MIRYHEADVVGLQEAMRSQLDELVALLPDYAWYDILPDGRLHHPEPDNEFLRHPYRKARFELLESATFWLSEPREVGSKGVGCRLPRISTWVRLEDKLSGKEFYHYFNTSSTTGAYR